VKRGGPYQLHEHISDAEIQILWKKYAKDGEKIVLKDALDFFAEVGEKSGIRLTKKQYESKFEEYDLDRSASLELREIKHFFEIEFPSSIPREDVVYMKKRYFETNEYGPRRKEDVVKLAISIIDEKAPTDEDKVTATKVITERLNELDGDTIVSRDFLSILGPALCRFRTTLYREKFVRTLSSKRNGNEVRVNPKDFVRANCSWCLSRTMHAREVKNTLRDAYECMECTHRTLKCIKCDAMCRGSSLYDDRLCLLHNGVIKSWDQPPDDFVEVCQKGYCSWCLHHSKHEVVDEELGLYRCTHCLMETNPCVDCHHAFAPSFSRYHRRMCAVCDDLIDHWETSGAQKFAKDIKKGFLQMLGKWKSQSSSQMQLNRTETKTASVDDKEEYMDRLSRRDIFRSSYDWHHHIKGEVLVDGKDTMEAMATAIEEAQSEIFMSFWWVTPTTYMRRNADGPVEGSQLDKMLTARAKDGVKVYVLLWDSVDFAIDNRSTSNQAYLEALHKNITVLTHPPVFPVMWSHHQKFLVADQAVAVLGGVDASVGRWDTSDHAVIDDECVSFPGIDYYVPSLGRPTKVQYQSPKEDPHDRMKNLRFPWHDIDMRVTGLAAYDVAANFIERWNHHRTDSTNQLASVGRFLTGTSRPILKQRPVGDVEKPKGTLSVRVIRSLAGWSGLSDGRKKEISIYGEYLRIIDSAKHCIYIEQQYVASSTAGHGVMNRVADALWLKIRRAVEQDQVFRVIILLPFAESGPSGSAIINWNFRTLSRGGESIFERLKRLLAGLDSKKRVEDYISVCSLRKAAIRDGRLRTEQIFVHAKLIIVDDDVAIVSSANLNDRSFAGDRDSELGVVVTDSDKVSVNMNGKQMMVSRSIHELRVKLWREHMCEEGLNVEDPVCDKVYENVWIETPLHNTALYEAAFPAIACNDIRSYDDLKERLVAGDANTAIDDATVISNLQEKVQGRLVRHPMKFLCEENLSPVDAGTKEGILGEEMFQ